MNLSKKSLYLIASSIMLGLGVIFFSLGITQYQVITSSRAEYAGIGCNDNIADNGLSTSGSTSFTISCSGPYETKGYQYLLYWCQDKATGASYCGDPLADPGSAIVKETGTFPINGQISKSTDKTCGCVQWDILVSDDSGTGIAGGALICSAQPCEQSNPTPTPIPTNPPQNTPVPTNPPQNTPVPTTPPATNTPVPTNPPGTSTPAPLTHTPTPSPTNTHTPSPTNSPTPTATNTPTSTFTPVPSNTSTPTPTNTPLPTNTPVPPTNTPIPTETPVPPTPTLQQVVIVENTPTPVTKLAVDNQNPGFNPWFALLIPFGLVILGLAL